MSGDQRPGQEVGKSTQINFLFLREDTPTLITSLVCTCGNWRYRFCCTLADLEGFPAVFALPQRLLGLCKVPLKSGLLHLPHVYRRSESLITLRK